MQRHRQPFPYADVQRGGLAPWLARWLVLVVGLAGLLTGVGEARARVIHPRASSSVAPWRTLSIAAWLGPLAARAQAAALAGRAVPGRDGVVRWRPIPPGLAAEASARPMRLQALIERAASGAVVARSQLCLRDPGAVRLRVVSAAGVQLAVDGRVVLRLRPWLALRPAGPAAAHEVPIILKAGCHPIRVALRSPRGRLTLGLSWRPTAASVGVAHPLLRTLQEARAPEVGPKVRRTGLRSPRTPRSRRAGKKARVDAGRLLALGQLVRLVQRGGARGPHYQAVRKVIAAGRAVHPGAALLHALSADESGDRVALLHVAGARWPHDVPLALALVRLLDEAGRPHEALRIWNTRLDGVDLRDSAACAARALLWQRLDVPRAARSLAAACARRFPNDRDGLEVVARLAAAADDLVGAAKARAGLLRQAPSDVERWLDVLGAYAELAEGVALTANAAEGRARLLGALSRAPAKAQVWDLARARNALGLAWLRRNQPRRAEVLLRGVPPWARRAITLELLGRSLLAQRRAQPTQRGQRVPARLSGKSTTVTTTAKTAPGERTAASTTPRSPDALRVEALALLREAMRRAPGRSDLRARVALLAPAKAFYVPHQRDLLGLARAATRRPISNAPFTQLLRQTVVRQLAPGRLARYEVSVWRVGRGGASTHDVTIDYVPSQATPEVLHAAIVRKNGRVDRSVNQRLETLNEDADGLYYDLEQIRLTYANLRPGDVLVSAYTLRDFAPDPFGLVFGELFQLGDAWPVLETEIVLELDPKVTPQSAWRSPAMTGAAALRRNVLQDRGLVRGADDKKRRWRRWRMHVGRLAGVAVEAEMPGASEVVDTLHVSSFTSWTDAARWYAKMVADALPEPGRNREVVRLAKGLTRGLTTPKSKVAAIFRWVADEIRYVGLEFGIHSLKPHAVGEVLARRFGDCKDKATLLVALLAEVGVPAQVALVRTAESGKLRDGIASLGGFGHAIAWVPSLGWWLDATLQYHQPTELPAGDVGGQALAIPREANATATLVDLPDAGATANRRIEHGVVQLNPQGGASISLTIRAHGLPAAALRERLHARVSRVERIQTDLAGRFPGLRVQRVQVAGVHPPADDVVVQVQGRVPRLLKGAPGAWSWQPLAPESPWRKRASGAATRTHPYVGAYAWRDERHVVVVPPKGWRLAATQRSRFQVGGLGSYKLEISAAGPKSWRFARTVVRGERVLPPERHQGLARWLSQLDVSLRREVRMTREGQL